MRLIESNGSLGPFCRAFENQVRNVPDLMRLTLEVEVLCNFESPPDSPLKENVRRDVAAYDRSTRKIFIHIPRFLALDPDVADAVLAHEIGHAYCHQVPMPAVSLGFLSSVVRDRGLGPTSPGWAAPDPRSPRAGHRHFTNYWEPHVNQNAGVSCLTSDEYAPVSRLLFFRVLQKRALQD
jgi:hypothetical protein